MWPGCRDGSRLIAPDTEGLESIDLTVGDLTGGGAHERVILQADPSDEIREVWQDVRVIMGIAAALFLCVGGLIYLGLARGLWPLADLEAAFDRLESQAFEARVPEVPCGNSIASISGSIVWLPCCARSAIVSACSSDRGPGGGAAGARAGAAR
jgi:hypothetical protein